MSTVAIFILTHVFAALLPPISSDDRDYYDVLGVPRNASEEDIRKVYKKKALALHPDKVAQFGHGDPEAAAREYEQVQEAYTVLSNPKKRQLYTALQYSPTRYQFVESGKIHNISSLSENLAHASGWTKLRLITVVGLFICLVLLQPILIASKVNQMLSEDGEHLEFTKWTVILIPLWIFHGLFLLGLLLAFTVAPPESRLSFLLIVLNQASWLTTEVLLALRWDRTLTNHYSVIFIPVYLGLILRCAQAADSLREVRSDVQKMVSSHYMMETVLHGRDMEELTEEERLELHHKYIVVHVPPDVVIEAETEEAMEQGRVESSPEFERAQEVIGLATASFWNTIVFGITFVSLVVAKLDNNIDASWWLVFIPIWIYLGSQFVYSGYTCCCATVSGHEIVWQVASNAEGNSENQETSGDHQEKVKSSNNDASDLFVAPEGSTRDFNQAEKPVNESTANPQDGPDLEPHEKSATTNDSGGDSEVSSKALASAPDASGAPIDDKKQSSKSEYGGAPDGAGDEQPNIHIDEETFRAWQSAYAEAEMSAQQEQARATMNCVVAGFQTLMLCLVVGKLENDYKSHPPQGYNAMWVLFPVFLLSGLCFCFCTCAICCSGLPETTNEDMDVQETVSRQDDDVEKNTEHFITPQSHTVVVSPPPTTTTQLASADESNVTEQANIQTSHMNDIADLD